MRDMIISCVQCDGTFVFSVAEQKRLDALGFDAPTRCPECRKRKQRALNKEEKKINRRKKQSEPWNNDSNEEEY